MPIPPAGFTTASPDSSANYDQYSLQYLEVLDEDGTFQPRSWRVRARRGAELIDSVARIPTALRASRAAWFRSYLIEGEGMHVGPEGGRELRGRGRAELLTMPHNPLAVQV